MLPKLIQNGSDSQNSASESLQHISRTNLEGLGVAARSIGHLAAHVTRLYEQGADSCRIGDYVQRWWGWLEAGLVAERQEATSARPGAVRPLPA